MSLGTALCEGCFRTLDEIAAWGQMNDAGKRAVWGLIVERAAPTTPALPQRKKE